MQLGNLLPHLQVNFLKAAGLSDILSDPLFGQDPPDEPLSRVFASAFVSIWRNVG